MPDNPQDEIKELYVTLQHLEVPIYFRYLLRMDKKFRPFLQAGMITRRAILQDFRYEFINGPDEYYRTANGPRSRFALEAFQAGVGAELALSKHWNVRSQLLYKGDVNQVEEEFFKQSYLGLELGLQYDF